MTTKTKINDQERRRILTILREMPDFADAVAALGIERGEALRLTGRQGKVDDGTGELQPYKARSAGALRSAPGVTPDFWADDVLYLDPVDPVTERLVRLEAVEDVNAAAERTARENRDRAERLRQEADQLDKQVAAA